MPAAVLFCLWCCGSAGAASRELQAHGSEERLWLVRVEPRVAKDAQSEVTSVFVRPKSDPLWQRLNPIGSRTLGVANRGTQLAILLANGDWLLTTDSGPTSGRPLPDRAHMIALGSDDTSLWAIGLVNSNPAPAPALTAPPNSRITRAAPGSAAVTDVERESTTRQSASPSTGPATRAATRPTPEAVTRPATSRSPRRLMLYQLGPQAWETAGPLPEQVPDDEGVSLSLAAVGGVPMLAHKASERVVNVFRRGDGGEWQSIDSVETRDGVRDYKVLQGTGGPVLWVRGASGPDRLWIWHASNGRYGEPLVKELPPRGNGGNADVAVAAANGSLRLLWVDDNKIYEQRLNAETGEPAGDVAHLPLPAVNVAPAFQHWSYVVMMAALIFAMAASARRHREMQDVALDPTRLPLAPYATRLLAGAIDAAPALAAMWLMPADETLPKDAVLLIKALLGYGAYVVLTTLVEVFAGRSIGKLVTGLHVVGLDGKPAPAGARVVRNVLRIIDFPLMPLALILFSPLRQRAGDIAAGTLVVRGKVPEAAADGDEAAQTNGNGPKQSDESMTKPE